MGSLIHPWPETSGSEKSRMNHFPSSVLRASSPQGEGFSLLDETEDSATPGKPCVQKDRKEAFGSCFSGIRTWIQDSSQNAVILRGAEGGVAESIFPERTFSLGEWEDRFRWVRKNLKPPFSLSGSNPEPPSERKPL